MFCISCANLCSLYGARTNDGAKHFRPPWWSHAGVADPGRTDSFRGCISACDFGGDVWGNLNALVYLAMEKRESKSSFRLWSNCICGDGRDYRVQYTTLSVRGGNSWDMLLAL